MSFKNGVKIRKRIKGKDEKKKSYFPNLFERFFAKGFLVKLFLQIVFVLNVCHLTISYPSFCKIYNTMLGKYSINMHKAKSKQLYMQFNFI